MKHSKKLSLALLSTLLLGITPANADDIKTDLNWNGDLRYRHEFISFENPPAGGLSSAYHQERIRARLGISPMIDENMNTEFRLASGPGRTGTNQTLGASANAFANYTIGIDRASFKRQGKSYLFSGGRMANSYFNPGDSDLIWDTDLNFDGLALGLKHNAGNLGP